MRRFCGTHLKGLSETKLLSFEREILRSQGGLRIVCVRRHNFWPLLLKLALLVLWSDLVVRYMEPGGLHCNALYRQRTVSYGRPAGTSQTVNVTCGRPVRLTLYCSVLLFRFNLESVGNYNNTKHGPITTRKIVLALVTFRSLPNGILSIESAYHLYCSMSNCLKLSTSCSLGNHIVILCGKN